MMISCLWYIKIQIAFSAESAHNFVQYDVEAAPHVAAFMAYAFQADSHTRSRGTQTDLIDQLNDLITKYDMERHWLYDLRPYLQGRCKLLELSTLSYSYLGCYVRDRLKMLDETQRKVIATSLLHFTLKENERCLIFHGSLIRHIESFPYYLTSEQMSGTVAVYF